MVIQKTKDYKIFKGIVGNRKVNQAHLKNLEVSIQKNNLLQFNPMIVNSQMQVIDGQHRLKAAQGLGIDIFYTVVKDGSLAEVQLLQTQRMWTTDDYLKSYIALGRRNYSDLEAFAKEYSFSIPYSILILTDKYEHPYKEMKDFKEGRFEISDLAKAENMASLINEVKKYCTDNAWKDREFLRALALVIEKVDQKQLLRKLEMFSIGISRRSSTREYLYQFDAVVNFRQQASRQTKLY